LKIRRPSLFQVEAIALAILLAAAWTGWLISLTR